MLLCPELATSAPGCVQQIGQAKMSRVHLLCDATIVWCIDQRGLKPAEGDKRSALDEVMSGYSSPDLIQDVGGAFRLCFPGRNQRAALSSIRKSLRLHQGHLPEKELVLMMHADCGFLKDPDLKQRSIEDPLFPPEMFALALAALERDRSLKWPGVPVNVRCIYVDFNSIKEIVW